MAKDNSNFSKLPSGIITNLNAGAELPSMTPASPFEIKKPVDVSSAKANASALKSFYNSGKGDK